MYRKGKPCVVCLLFPTLACLPFMAKLTKVKIGKIVAQKRYGLSSSLMGKNVGVSKRRVNQVLKEYKDKREYPRINKPGRKRYRVLKL